MIAIHYSIYIGIHFTSSGRTCDCYRKMLMTSDGKKIWLCGPFYGPEPIIQAACCSLGARGDLGVSGHFPTVLETISNIMPPSPPI